MTFTGLPVSSSSDAALPANASGISSLDGGMARWAATTSSIGSSAATEPLRLISAVTPATSSITRTSSRRLLPPAPATSLRPTQVVTPVASRPSLTTNSAPMRMTVGSPKPATAWSSPITPVARSSRAEPIATTSTGSQFVTNSTTTRPRTARLMTAPGTTAGVSRHRAGPASPTGGEARVRHARPPASRPGPAGVPPARRLTSDEGRQDRPGA